MMIIADELPLAIQMAASEPEPDGLREGKKRFKDMLFTDENTGKLVCSVCTSQGIHSSFANTYTANRHIEGTHLNLRAYQCDYCEKRFKTKSQRTDHYSKVHKNQYQSTKIGKPSQEFVR